MRICLVTPPSEFLLDERVFMSLGILKVAAALEATGEKVEHLDLSGVENFMDVVAEYAHSAPKGTVYGLTATTPQMPSAAKIASYLRPFGKVILGGPHATLVNAAAKREIVPGRASLAQEALLAEFDSIVAGDGELAIGHAIYGTGLIDADDPKSPLWQTSADFEISPLPARHLVDVSSYHYEVDGTPALSMISQLGCLTPDTPIVLSSGIEIPISEIKVGDYVRCYAAKTGETIYAPVAETYQREAEDIWEVKWENGAILRITGEHPIYTGFGWKTIEEIEIGWVSAQLQPVRERIPSTGATDSGEMVQQSVSLGVAKDPSQPSMAVSWTSQDALTFRVYDERAEDLLLHRRAQQHAASYPQHPGEAFQYQEGRFESNEAPRSSSESIGNRKSQMGKFLRESDEGKLEERDAKIQPQGSVEGFSKQTGNYSHRNPWSSPNEFLLRGEWSILDWPMPVGKTQEPRLGKQEIEKSDSTARGVLAYERGSGDRSIGLLEQGVASADRVVKRASNKEAPRFGPEAEDIWGRIISKRLIGKGTVHNITVHPAHNYFANGVLVHNCPFECGFCGGRLSPMLRRIRTRTSQSVIEEILHLNQTYGVKGIMFYDDELNVNRGMVQLMKDISATGIDWRLRGFVKAELFTEEQAESMFAAGFRWLLCGFESAHPIILRNINKKATRADNTNMLRIAHNAGLKVKALMSFGHPGESEETILTTRDWLLQEKPDDFDCTIITTYPGTSYYDSAKLVDGVYVYNTWGDKLYSHDPNYSTEAQYYKGKIGEYKSYVWTDHLTSERLVELRDMVEAEVRDKLGIPYPHAQAALRYEHSVGMNHISQQILR